MAKIEVPYPVLCERHPDKVAEVLQDRAKSRSKSKGVPPENCTWFYVWAVQIKPFSFREALQREPVKASSPREEMEETLSNTMAWIACSHGRGYWGSSSFEKGYVPPEIRTLAEKACAEEEVELRRIQSMTPLQQQQELEDLLHKLRKTKGVTEIRMPFNKDEQDE